MSERHQRQLSAILAADVAGYSHLIGLDDEGTLTRLKELRRTIIDPKITEHRGRIVKTMGDGLLVQFASAVDAVRCAVDIQRQLAEQNVATNAERRMEFRMGVNVGDVVIDGDDIHGDGVNVAARLEGLAEPGGICVSGSVHDQVRDKLDLAFEDSGDQKLKNIVRPVPVYRVQLGTDAQIPPKQVYKHKPSIAVLPFQNMSSDPEQEYFVDGLAEDLITDLSKVPGLFVISRHSAFAFKGKSIDIRSIANDLGVRYVVEGSVRRAAARIRINVQLVDAEDGTHPWADRFDRDLADIFMLQDEVVGKMVNALAGVLPSARPVTGQRPTNLEAYDLFVRGRLLVTQSVESNREARSLLERSIELDPNFADAHAWLAMSYLWGWTYLGRNYTELHRSFALTAAQLAVSLDPQNANGHAILGEVLVNNGEFDAGAAELATALQINPNLADAWIYLVDMKVIEGKPLEGITNGQKAFRLNPHPPGWYYWLLGYAEYAAGRYEDAIKTLRHKATHRSGSQRILAASLAQLGRMEEAKVEAAEFLSAQPDFSVKQWVSARYFVHEADPQHFVDGYVKAGLPM